MEDAQTRAWKPPWACPVEQVWGVFRMGDADPTYRIVDGHHWRALNTPSGLASLAVAPLNTAGMIEAEAWGPGAGWALDRLPTMLGADDDPSGFRPDHPLLIELHRRRPDWRIGRSASAWDVLVPTIIAQKVTSEEATFGVRALLARYGQPAPGPAADLGLRAVPTASVLRLIPSWEWLELKIDPARSRTLLGVAAVVSSLERMLAADPATADVRLRSLPGIGVWTSAEVRARALGDADAVSFGDYHVAADLGWALTGAEVDDEGLAELLEPYRHHRLRVQRLIGAAGMHRPRRGPRMARRTHLC